jgi:DNA-binding CsgD family transcriptional regulator
VTAPVVGRVRELRELTQLVDAAARGEGGAVVLGGEPGIGKSRLAEAAAEYASSAGLRVAWGRCREGLAGPPFWPWLQVVRGLDASVDWSGEGGNRFRLFQGVLDVLRQAARAAPGLLVLLDDVHRADDSSLRLLGFVADQLHAEPLALVVTYRDAECGPGLTRLLTDLATQSHCSRNVVEGLSVHEVRDWLTDVPGVTQDRATEMHDRTGGNPFFLREVLRLLEEHPAGSDVPVSVRDVIRSRIAQLPPDCRLTLEGAAVLGREFGEATLAAVLGEGPDATAAALRPAVVAHLVEPGRDDGRRRFVHALVAESLLEGLNPTRRAELHARALAVLPFSASLEPSQIAHHALAARGVVPDDMVLDAVFDAARDADDRLAWTESAAWWRRSTELGGPREQTALALGRALLRSGEVTEARTVLARLGTEARRRGDAAVVAEAALMVGESMTPIAPDRSLLSMFDEALAMTGVSPALRIRLAARRAMIAFWTPGGVPEARRAAADAVDAARATGDDEALGAALVALQFTLRGPEDPGDRISVGEQVRTLAESRGDDELRFESCRWLVPDLFQAGQLFAARTVLDVAAGIAEERRDPQQRWWVQVFRTLLAGFDGAGDGCMSLALETRSLGRRLDEPAADVYCLAQLFPEYRRLGRVGELEAELRAAVSDFPTLPTLSCMAALLAADLGRRDEASTMLEALAAPDALPQDQLLLASLAILGEAAVQLGDAATAAGLAARLAPYSDRNLVQGVPVGWGSAAWHLARLCRTAGDEEAAQRYAAQARALHRQWGAGAWGRPLVGLDVAAAHRPLSAREQEVMALVARGLTNKAIAALLHLSVHTVERHVINVLRKLDVHNRAEATAWAHRSGLVD